MKNIKKKETSNRKRGIMGSHILKTSKLVCLFVVLLVLAIQVAYAQNYEEYKPYLHKPTVGNVPNLDTYGTYETPSSLRACY